MLDSRLLLLLLLLSRVNSVSVEVEILTGRQLSAALTTEDRLAVYWCKSSNLSYWAYCYHPLPSPSPSLAVDQIINCITPATPALGQCLPHKSLIYSSTAVIVMAVGGAHITYRLGKQRN